MTDIATLIPKPRSVAIKHPATSKPIGLSITVLPESHPKVRDALHKKINARLQAKEHASSESIEAHALDLIAAAVDGWEWGASADGEPTTFEGEQPDFSDQAFRRVLTVLPWIRAQLDVELSDSASFY